jgi:glucosamine--fructose-6-phosphate aminotransferase (isomerizing)
MEYRGYDSAGIATFRDGRIAIRKGVGKVADVNAKSQLESLPGYAGIGHTRWATHGGVSEANAHPHSSWSGRIAIVHNGIIENYEELKEEVGKRGYLFRSETDSEVIANLLQCNQDLGMEVEEALLETVQQLKGKYSFVALFDDGTLAAARNSAPLILGIGKDGFFVSSDVIGFLESTDEVIYLENREFVVMRPQSVRICDFDANPATQRITKVSREFADSDKGSYVHFTLKEICEQPATILRAGINSKSELERLMLMLEGSSNIYWERDQL